MTWKINSGLVWAGLGSRASTWKISLWPIMSNFWGRFFQFSWKHCSNSTENLHRKKDKKIWENFFFSCFCLFYRLEIWVYNIEVGSKHLFSYLWHWAQHGEQWDYQLILKNYGNPMKPIFQWYIFQTFGQKNCTVFKINFPCILLTFISSCILGTDRICF